MIDIRDFVSRPCGGGVGSRQRGRCEPAPPKPRSRRLKSPLLSAVFLARAPACKGRSGARCRIFPKWFPSR